MTYRHTGTIEAAQFTGCISDIVSFVGKGAKYAHGVLTLDDGDDTIEMQAGDWAVRDAEGVHVATDAFFRATYEPIPVPACPFCLNPVADHHYTHCADSLAR